jgi:hypothetical protein
LILALIVGKEFTVTETAAEDVPQAFVPITVKLEFVVGVNATPFVAPPVQV